MNREGPQSAPAQLNVTSQGRYNLRKRPGRQVASEQTKIAQPATQTTPNKATLTETNDGEVCSENIQGLATSADRQAISHNEYDVMLQLFALQQDKATIENVKVNIQEREGITLDEQRLTVASKELDDESTLAEHDTQIGSHLCLVPLPCADLTTAVDAEAQVEKEMLSSTPSPALPTTPVYSANCVVPSDMQTFEPDATLTKRALNGAFHVIAHSEEELNEDSIRKESYDKQMKTCCSEEPSLNNDASGSSKCVIDKGRLNFSPCLVKLRRDGKLVQDSSAIVAKAMQVRRGKRSSTPVCSSDYVLIDLHSDGEDPPDTQALESDPTKEDEPKKYSKKKEAGSSKRKESVTGSPPHKRGCLDNNMPSCRSDNIDYEDAKGMATWLKMGEGLLDQIRATIHGESSDHPDLDLTTDSSLFKTMTGQEPFKLYEQCLLPYDQLELIGQPISQLEEVAAHNAMMNLAILRHLTLTSVTGCHDLSQSQKKLTELEVEVADQAAKINDRDAAVKGLKLQVEKLNEEKELLIKGLEYSKSELADLKAKHEVEKDEAFNKGRVQFLESDEYKLIMQRTRMEGARAFKNSNSFTWAMALKAAEFELKGFYKCQCQIMKLDGFAKGFDLGKLDGYKDGNLEIPMVSEEMEGDEFSELVSE